MIMKLEIVNTANGKVSPVSIADACKAMTGLESLRRQRAYLIERLGVFRDACVTLRVRKQRTESRLNAELREVRRDSERALRLAERDRQALLDKVDSLAEENRNLCDEIERLQEAFESVTEDNKRLTAELDAEREESEKWRDIAERCFASAMKNAVTLADERNGKRGE